MRTSRWVEVCVVAGFLSIPALARYETKIFLNGKATHLVAAVYDRASGKIAAAEAEVAIKHGSHRIWMNSMRATLLEELS